MQSATHRISLDIHDTASQATVSVKKGDSKRTIIATLTECGKPYPIDADCTAVIRFKKPDGTVVYSDCSVGFSGIVCHLTTQATSAVGSVGCEITIYGSDNKQITSPRFDMIVDDTVYSDIEVESSDEFTALSKAMAQFGGISGATERAEAAASSASAYKENAEISATMAEISMESAQSYRNSAASSAETAATAATNAASSAAAAASSAETAATDATNAAASETAAETAKAAAETAADNASTAAGNAASAAAAASGHANTAYTAAATATDKASAADSSAQEAAASAAAAADAHKMKLIRKITTTKDVKSVTINQDTNDLAFSLDKFVLLITAPSDLVPNNGTFNVYVPDASASSNRIYTPGNVIYNTKKIVVRSEIIGDGETAVFDTWASCSIFGSAPSGTTQHGDFVTGKPITSVTATYTSNSGFPAGTEIKLYGHRG